MTNTLTISIYPSGHHRQNCEAQTLRMVVEKSNSFHQLLQGGQYNPILIDVDSEDVTEDRTDVWASISKSEAETAIKKRTYKSASSKGDKGKDKNKCKESTPPISSFECVREMEMEKRDRIKRMGAIPAFDSDMAACAAVYGPITAKGKALLATLSDYSPLGRKGFTSEDATTALSLFMTLIYL